MKVIYDWIIPFKGYKAITIYPFIFSHGEMSDRTLRHEKIHIQQQLEVMVLGLFCSIPMALNYSWWWLLSGIILFYAIYIAHYILNLFRTAFHATNSYYNICFEYEAHTFDDDINYLDKRIRFRWLAYLFKKIDMRIKNDTFR